MKKLLFTTLGLCLASGVSFSQGGDECVGATNLGQGDTSSAFSTVGASTSAAPTQCFSFSEDVWFSWTPSVSGNATFDTCNNATFDTEIGVYSGTCSAAVPLGCNDDFPGCAGNTSTITVPVVCGQTYRVQVGYWSSSGGTFGSGTLTVTQDNSGASCVPPDTCADAAALAGEVTDLPFDNTGFTASGDNPGCASGTNPVDIWYEWTASEDGNYLFDLCGSGFDTRLAVWDSCGGTVLACNDDSGPACGGLQRSIQLDGVLSGDILYLQVGGFSGATGAGDLTIFKIPPPGEACSTAFLIGPGDSQEPFDTTLSIPSGDNPGCGGVGTDPIDVWYEWSASNDGVWRFETCGADFDTRIALWDACGGSVLACNDDSCGLQSVVEYPVQGGSSVFVQVGGFLSDTGTGDLKITKSTPVRPDNDGDGFDFFMDCDDSDPLINPDATEICGNGIDENCSGSDATCPPDNDDCAGRTEVFEGANFHDSTAATPSGIMASGLPDWVDNFTPDTACQSFNADVDNLFDDVFYNFTARNASYLISTCNMANYDTKLAIYSGTCGAPVALACNDDGTGCAGFSSELRVTGLNGGATYILQVGGFSSGQQGTATLDISRTSGAQNYCSSNINSSGNAATMSYIGSTSVAVDDFSLQCNGMPLDDEFGFSAFLVSLDKASAPLPFSGNGLQCVASPFCRLYPPQLSVGGVATKVLDAASFGPGQADCPFGAPTAGATFNFQCYFRDNGSAGLLTSSDGIAVTFEN